MDSLQISSKAALPTLRRTAAALGLLLFCAAPSALFAADPYPVAGEIIFTELMISPATASGHEWAELYSRATGPRRLDGCMLKEGTSGKCMLNGVEVAGNCYTLPTTTPFSIGTGAYQVVAKEAASLLSTCALPSTDYNTLTLNDSGTETIELLCPNADNVLETVSTFTYNWTTIGGAKGQSWMLDQAFIPEGDAQDSTNWCLAPTTLPMCTVNGTPALVDYGTPGAVSACPIPPKKRRPSAGDVIFSELNIWPTSTSASPEWIELLVKSAPILPDEPDMELNGCQLKTVNCGTLSAADCLAQPSPTFTTTVTLLGSAESYYLTEGDTVTLGGSTTKTCLSVDPVNFECLLTADVPYSTEVLFNSDVRLLELSCPDSSDVQQLVDRVVYSKDRVDSDCQQADEHCSWELRAASLDATGNDDPENWGAAPIAAIYTASTGPIEAYGTPDAPNLVSPRVYKSPIQEGDMLFTELAIWPGTDSSDWIELEVLTAPADDVYDVGSCVLRTLSCSDNFFDEQECLLAPDLDTPWANTSSLTPVGTDAYSPLYAVLGNRVLLGSSSTRTTLEVDSTGAPVTTADGTFASSVGLFTTELRLLELACTQPDQSLVAVDRMVYNKEWVDESCSRDDLRCSWTLRPPEGQPAPNTVDSGGRQTARTLPLSFADNDSPVSWGSSEAPYIYTVVSEEALKATGTPGRANDLPGVLSVAGWPATGDVAFSELMIDPATGDPEWLELQGIADGASGEPLELAGCQIIQAPLTSTGIGFEACAPVDPNADPLPEPIAGCKSYSIPSTLSFPIDQDQQRLLVKGDACLSYGGDSGTECLIPADLKYTDLELSTTARQQLTLWCPNSDPNTDIAWVPVDSLEFNWPDYESRCPLKTVEGLEACSLSIHPDHVNAIENDDLFYRCVSQPELNTYPNPLGALISGTPGEPNLCADLPNPPGPGDLMFSELMISPRGFSEGSAYTANEWFELLNVGDSIYDFRSCRFLVGPPSEDGTLDELDAQDSLQENNTAVIEPGQYQVWAENGCLFEGPEGCGSPDGDAPLDNTRSADVGYTGLSFSNSSKQILLLRCDGPENESWIVDAITFDFEAERLETGHSWIVMPEFLSAEGNDLDENWCQASYQLKFFETDEGCNYGSPGTANTCPGPVPYAGDEIAPGCRCDGGDGRASFTQWGLALLLGLHLGLRRRKSA